jgi:hypothetical protein
MNHMENTSTTSRLPGFFRPILWSYDFDALDLEAHKRAIIINTINYGDLPHWRWIIAHYGKAVIQDLLETLPTTELRPRAGRLASIIFSLTPLHDAPRSTH